MSGALVFDTGPLSHFAEAGWLKILAVLAEDRTVLIPEVVNAEIAAATHIHPFLGQIREADWIKVDRSDDVEFIVTPGPLHATAGDRPDEPRRMWRARACRGAKTCRHHR